MAWIIICVPCRSLNHRATRASSGNVSIDQRCVPECSMDPPCSKGRKSVIPFVKCSCKNVRPAHWWTFWCSLATSRNPLGDGSRRVCVCEASNFSPNFRRLGPWDLNHSLNYRQKLLIKLSERVLSLRETLCLELFLILPGFRCYSGGQKNTKVFRGFRGSNVTKVLRRNAFCISLLSNTFT